MWKLEIRIFLFREDIWYVWKALNIRNRLSLFKRYANVCLNAGRNFFDRLFYSYSPDMYKKWPFLNLELIAWLYASVSLVSNLIFVSECLLKFHWLEFMCYDCTFISNSGWMCWLRCLGYFQLIFIEFFFKKICFWLKWRSVKIEKTSFY